MRTVDVTKKDDTERKAVAYAVILTSEEAIKLIKEGKVEKGDILTISKAVGLQGAKVLPLLLPFCHPLLLTDIEVDFKVHDIGVIEIFSTVKNIGKTGVEIEALSACALAALNFYDMLKRHERWTVIKEIMLLEKEGGKSGHVKRNYLATGKVVGLGKSEKRGDKERCNEIKLIEKFGVEGDVHAGTDKQISIFPLEALSRVPSSKFTFGMNEITENISIIGIPEYFLLPGKKLRIGEAEILIERIGKEEYVDQGRPFAVSRWGRFGRILKGGKVKLYDEVQVLL